MFIILGALGLVLISIGVITKKRELQDISYILGGLLLVSYSIYIRDTIFIILQIIFTITAIYDMLKS